MTNPLSDFERNKVLGLLTDENDPFSFVSPTGRYLKQRIAADDVMQRMHRVMSSIPGVKRVSHDVYEIHSADYALIELRIMAAMQEKK